MSNFAIEKSIEIHAPISRVWQVFTDPVLTREMGGEYVSDWQVGSFLGWKGLDGKLLTNGTIMKIERERLLQHTLLNSVGSVGSVITYEFVEKQGVTTIQTREDFNGAITDQELKDSTEGWEAALRALKVTAER
jgi:uncharacterized protein YndB with AHSA1/START domain